jgi:Carboxypeptidase regulatory-like domain
MMPVGALLAGCASVGSGEAAEKPAPALRAAVATSVVKPNVLAGRVTGETGKPVAAARVVVNCGADHREAQSNAEGYFASDELPSGHWSAHVEHVRYAPSHRVEFAIGNEQPLPVMLFVMRAGAALHVILTDGKNNPIRHATLQVVGPEGFFSKLRDAGKGQYESQTGLPSGELALHVTAEEFAPLDQSFPAKPGGTTQLELALQPASAPAKQP